MEKACKEPVMFDLSSFVLLNQVKEQLAGCGGAAVAEACGPVTKDKSGAVTIRVHAKPGSKHSSITGVCITELLT